MTDLRDPALHTRSLHDEATTRYDMRELDRRMRLWELANGILCALFLWAPMAAAAFHRVG